MNITPISFNRNQTKQNTSRQNPNFGMKFNFSDSLKTTLGKMFPNDMYRDGYSKHTVTPFEVADSLGRARAEHNANPRNHIHSEKVLQIINVIPNNKTAGKLDFSKNSPNVDTLQIQAKDPEDPKSPLYDVLIDDIPKSSSAGSFDLKAEFTKKLQQIQDFFERRRSQQEFVESLKDV